MPSNGKNTPTLYLGTNEPSWLWNRDMGETRLFISRRRFERIKTWKPATSHWALDSGGFTELSKYGSWQVEAEQYAAFVARLQSEVGNMDWAAPMDCMNEPDILRGGGPGGFHGTGLSHDHHLWFTVENFCELVSIWPQVSDGSCPFIPVLQGWTGAHYLKCERLYERAGVNLADYHTVGMGSVCRRQSTLRINYLAQMFSHLPLHMFGIKLEGLQRVAHLIHSGDTTSWSLDARWLGKPFLSSCTHQACNSCPDYAAAWHRRQLAVLDGIRTAPITAA